MHVRSQGVATSALYKQSTHVVFAVIRTFCNVAFATRFTLENIDQERTSAAESGMKSEKDFGFRMVASVSGGIAEWKIICQNTECILLD